MNRAPDRSDLGLRTSAFFRVSGIGFRIWFTPITTAPSVIHSAMNNTETPAAKIEVTRNGPYLVSGGLPLSEQWIVTNAEGESLEYREEKRYPAQPQYGLCRCGQSAHKPFCDGTHNKVKFDGTETASHQPYL